MWNEVVVDFGDNTKRSLRPDKQLSEIKDASFPIPYIPQMIPSRVFAHLWCCGLDLVVVLFEQIKRFFVEVAFEITLRHLFDKFRFVQRLYNVFFAVCQYNFEFCDIAISFAITK